METKLTKKDIDAILKRNQIEDNLLPVVHQYCSPQLTVAEYEFLKAHSELLVSYFSWAGRFIIVAWRQTQFKFSYLVIIINCLFNAVKSAQLTPLAHSTDRSIVQTPALIEALIIVAITANNRGDETTAYFFHRKAELLRHVTWWGQKSPEQFFDILHRTRSPAAVYNTAHVSAAARHGADHVLEQDDTVMIDSEIVPDELTPEHVTDPILRPVLQARDASYRDYYDAVMGQRGEDEASEARESFFVSVGPPPHCDEDYFDRLAQQYFDGDNLFRNILLQSRAKSEAKNSASTAPLSEEEKVKAQMKAEWLFLIRKYLDKDEIEVVGDTVRLREDEHVTEAEERERQQKRRVSIVSQQAHNRRQLIEDFVHNRHEGMKLLLNWLESMPPATRTELFEHVREELLNTIFGNIPDSLNLHFDYYLHRAEIVHCCPELLDLAKLGNEDCAVLFDTMIKISLGKENLFSSTFEQESLKVTQRHYAKLLHDVFSAVTQRTSHVLNSENGAETPVTWTLTPQDDVQIWNWLEKAKNRSFPSISAHIYLSWERDTFLIRKFASEDPRLLQTIAQRRGTLQDYELPYLLFRSRALQLLVLQLIHICLNECLNHRDTLSGKKRKRKVASS